MSYPIKFNKILVISISKLAQDIEDSVLRPNDGYWDKLVNNDIVGAKPLQDSFENAIRDIYNSTSIMETFFSLPLL